MSNVHTSALCKSHVRVGVHLVNEPLCWGHGDRCIGGADMTGLGLAQNYYFLHFPSLGPASRARTIYTCSPLPGGAGCRDRLGN